MLRILESGDDGGCFFGRRCYESFVVAIEVEYFRVSELFNL
jgi:hypothetical protein